MTLAIDKLRISTTYLRRLAREHPQPQTVLKELGFANITPRDTATVPLADYFELLRSVDRCRRDRGWHLGIGLRTADHFHGPLTYALMSAPTIGHGLEAFSHYISIRAPHFECTIRQADLHHFIVLNETIDLGDVRRILFEVGFSVFHDYVGSAGDVNLAAATLYLAHTKKPNDAYYADGFNCSVHFAHPENALAIPSAWTALPNPQYDELMWENALAQCETALAAQRPANTLNRTRSYVEMTLKHDPKSLCIENAAAELNMSVRTLIRRLQVQGTSFQTLRDAERRDRAVALLSRSNLTVTAIARSLGFSDTANFSRAFKRWLDVPPARYRRQRTAGGTGLIPVSPTN